MSGSSSAALAKRASASKRGSMFSDKQIAYAVKNGRPITVTFPDGLSLSGWVYGADDFHWGLVDSSGETHLVHKSVPRVTIHREDWAEMPDLVAEKVSAYRDYVMREHFGQKSDPATT